MTTVISVQSTPGLNDGQQKFAVEPHAGKTKWVAARCLAASLPCDSAGNVTGPSGIASGPCNRRVGPFAKCGVLRLVVSLTRYGVAASLLSEHSPIERTLQKTPP